MGDAPIPTCSNSAAKEEECLEKLPKEETFADSSAVAKVIDTRPSSNEATPVSDAAQSRDGIVSRPQVTPKDNSDELHESGDGKALSLGSGDSLRNEEGDNSATSGLNKSEGKVDAAGDECTEDDLIWQGKRKSKRDVGPSESAASSLEETVSIDKVPQDTKAEKVEDAAQGSTPSGGDSESSVASSSESGSESDHNRSNDANNGTTDERNQVFITIETPLFVRNHYVYLPNKKNMMEDDDKEKEKDDTSGAGPSASGDPSVDEKKDTGPSKRKHSSGSESDPEAKMSTTNKRQRTESDEKMQRALNAVKQNQKKNNQEDLHHKEGRTETREGKVGKLIDRPSGYGDTANKEKQKEEEGSSKAASLKRPIEDDEDGSRQASPKRRRHASGPEAAHDLEQSKTQVSDRTDEPQSGELEARPAPQDRAGEGAQVSPTPRRRRSFTERYYEDAPILPPQAEAAATASTKTTEGASTTEAAAASSGEASPTDEKKPPSPLGPPWNMYDARNPESATIRGTKKERYNLRIAQAMVDNAINTVLQELGFSPGNSRRKRRRRRERERQRAAFEEAGVSSAIQSQGLSMAPRGGARGTMTSPGCPHHHHRHRRTSDLNAGAGPSSASLPVPENEDEFERLAVSEAISQAGLSKAEDSKEGSKDKDSSA